MRVLPLLFLVLACLKKEDGADSGGTEADTDTDTDADTDADPTGDCAFVGSWTLEQYLCGEADITAAWTSFVPSTTFEITHHAGGGCDIALRNTSPSCDESESIVATEVAAPTYELAFQGIASCDPAGCTFAADDAPCVVGDRVEQGEALLTLESASLRVTYLEDGLCGGAEGSILFAPQ